jgi:hypothetical protein
VYTAGVGLLALPLLYVLSMCGASAIVFYLDKAFMNGAFVKWVKYSGNQVTKSILPIYRYTLPIVPSTHLRCCPHTPSPRRGI